MTHDLIALAKKCEAGSDFFCKGCLTVSRVEWDILTDSASALREAHEELQYFRAFRDELQAANTKLTLENRELRELVKRHEDALEWVSASKNHMKKSEGDSRGMFESWHGVGALSATHLNKRFANSPLAAIEAATKEEK